MIEPMSRYQRIDLILKTATMCLAVIGGLGVIVSIRGNADATRANEFARRSQNMMDMYNLVTTLDRAFVAQPELYPYFYVESGEVPLQPPPPGDAKHIAITAMAVHVLDVLDAAVKQSTVFADLWDTPGAWDEWAIDSFAESPTLVKFLNDHSRWYGEAVHEAKWKGLERAAKRFRR